MALAVVSAAADTNAANAPTTVPASLSAAAQALSAPEPVAIQHVSVVNVVNGRIQKDVTVLLRDGAIAAIGRRIPLEKAKVVDGAGKFLIPGLWDMHVHCCNPEDHLFPLFLANGVTGIRDMAGPLAELKACRANVENGTILGPRMAFAGPMVDGGKPFWPECTIIVGTADEGRKAVERVQRDGAGFLKVYSSLPREAYFAIAEEATRRHLVFAGHVPDAITAAEASDAGQKSFEHLLGVIIGCSRKEDDLRTNSFDGWTMVAFAQRALDSYDAKKAKTLFARFRRNGTWQCPTLTALNSVGRFNESAFRNDQRLAYLAPDLLSQWNPTNHAFMWKGMTPDYREARRLVFPKACELVGVMARSGVGILAGSDTPNPGAFPGFGLHDELVWLVKCGLTPRQALQTATLNPARYFGQEKTMGTVQARKAADLVLLHANPLEDIHNTTKIAAVFVRGRYLDRAALDRMIKSRSDSAPLQAPARELEPETRPKP